MYGASGLPTTSLSSRFSMTMTITCGGPAGAAVVAWVPEDAAEVVEPAGVGLGGSRLGTTIDGAALDGDDAGVGLPHPATATSAATARTRRISETLPSGEDVDRPRGDDCDGHQ